jgi:autotransporter passenger strand-loop-strand repeat protein
MTNGETLDVFFGGTAVGTVVSSGGIADVYGTASGGIVSSGGFENVTGLASGATIENGGSLTVWNFGTADDITLNSGGLLVWDGGTTSGVIVNSGGSENVSDEGTAIGTIVSGGGTEDVLGGTAIGSIVSGGGTEVVGVSLDSNGTASGTVVSSGGLEVVSAGGTASGTTVSNGGTEVVYGGIREGTYSIPGGEVLGTTVSSGGTLIVEEGATAIVIVNSGGTVLNSGGSVYFASAYVVSSGQTSSGVTLQYADTETVLFGGTAIGTTVNDGGVEYVSSGGTASGVVLNVGGTAELDGGALVSGAIVFAGSGADLLIDATTTASMPAAVISGFVANTTIDLTGVAYDSRGSATLQGDELQIVEHGATLDLLVSDVAYTSATTFMLADDGSGHTDIATDATCYRAGTLIRTDHGDIPVEALRVGDRVASAFGGTATVTWLGHRRVDCRRHPRPHDVWPVRVAAGAFGANQPRRDLFLSPDHAVFFGGVLIPIRYLINDATIVQEPVNAVSYWHVELPEHGVLLAEGMPAESYLDTGNRGAFANGGTVVSAQADFALRVWEAKGCAPLVMAGPRLAAVKARLIARLPALGFTTTDVPGLRWLLDSAPITPLRFGAWCLVLPRGASRLALHSRRARPAELDPASDDTRLLGVAVRALRLDGCETPLDDRRFAAGWHAAEHDLRWTDGAGVLSVEGASVVELLLHLLPRYHAAREAVARAA